MNLDTLLEQGKKKYNKEIEQERQRERIVYRRSQINNLVNDFINRNMAKIESFNTIYPYLKLTFNQDATLGIQKYGGQNGSGIAWLNWEFRNDTFDIVFYSRIGYPNGKITFAKLTSYDWKDEVLQIVDYDATDVEITQAINDALIAMLQNYLEI